MALSSAFNTAIAEKNITKIRIMLKDSLLVDPTFTRFQEMEKAARSIPGLYDEHDARPFIEDTNLWTDHYMNTLIVQVVGNFSHERVEHLKKVVRYLRPVKNLENVSENNKSSVKKDKHSRKIFGPSEYQRTKERDFKNGNARMPRMLFVGGVIGAGAGGAVGMLTSLSTAATVACATGGAAVGVAAVYLAIK